MWASSEVLGAHFCPCCHGGLPGRCLGCRHISIPVNLSPSGPGSPGMSRCTSAAWASTTPALLGMIAPRRSTPSERLAGNMAFPCQPDLPGLDPGHPSSPHPGPSSRTYFPFLLEHSLKRMRIKFFPGAHWCFSPLVRSWWLSPHCTLLSGRRDPAHADLRPPTCSDAQSCLHLPCGLDVRSGHWGPGASRLLHNRISGGGTWGRRELGGRSPGRPLLQGGQDTWAAGN